MNGAIEISKLIDKYFPANGVGTEREQIRLEMHNDLVRLVKNLTIPHIINSATAQMIHYDLAIKANELMKQHNFLKVKDFRELPEVKRLWNAMDVIKEHYL